MKLNSKDKEVLTEVRRRIKEFKNSDIHAKMVFLGLPNEAKSLINKGILTPYSTETPRVRNWYNLTELGKQFI
jgi:hypothetical protein